MIAAPLQHEDRIQILDIVRGFALCGILILNIYFFGRPEPALLNLDVYGETGFGNISTWYITNFLVEGSFRALFSMLFGAGCILLVSRLQQKNNSLQPADIYYTRLIWLLIFGLFNAYILLWPGDILYSYAICGLLIFPFRHRSVRILLLMVAFFISITILKAEITVHDRIAMRDKGEASLKLRSENKELSDEQKGDIDAWEKFKNKRKPSELRKESEEAVTGYRQPSWSKVFGFVAPIDKILETTIFYDEFFFDVMVFIFLGMALYKLRVLTGERPAWLYVVFVVFGYTIGLGQGYMQGHSWRVAQYDYFRHLELDPFGVDLYQIHRVFVAFANLGVIVLLWKSGLFKGFLRLFSNVGQMAFSNYLMQSMICTLFFYGYGFGFFGKLERYELWYVVVGVWVFQIIFSAAWLRFFRFGPLEWIWRSLTYWQRQPFRIRSDAGSTSG